MQITRLTAGQAGPAAFPFPGGVAAAQAVLNDQSGTQGLGQQLKAYQALAGRWRQAPAGERAALAQVLTDSPFAQGVHSTLNAFTRAAWAGPDAVPPKPQIQMLKAFDDLSAEDQEIVAAMQVDASGAPAFASAADYRARLQADLEAARGPDLPRRPDSITLSAEAQTRLAGGAAAAETPQPVVGRTRADLAQAIAAYRKAAG